MHPLIELARRSIQTRLQGTHEPMPESSTPTPPQACFVSLKIKGELRGCIGTLAPTQPFLEAEVWVNARSSAFQDPRFAPLTLGEWPQVKVSVDVLTPPEPISGPEVLDPARYGVIVSWQGRRGVLLPHLEGVDTVSDQIAICRRKAGIPPQVPVTLERFCVERIEQEE